MKCAALLSGGKDSVAAVEVAQGHGWEVVVGLAMHPAQDDAWMYHTPNLDAVRGVADCLGVPLEEVAARTGADEEVQDLQDALSALQAAHGIDAVVSGALASEYQRTRIDRVGHRLGLKTFAPLWHKDPQTYMAGLLQGGYDIRLSRVACDGMDGTWAGRRMDEATVAAIQALPGRPHVAGEGGEFETLVLDAPHYRKRIVVDAADIEAEGPHRATWVVKQWHTEDKA